MRSGSLDYNRGAIPSFARVFIYDSRVSERPTSRHIADGSILKVERENRVKSFRTKSTATLDGSRRESIEDDSDDVWKTRSNIMNATPLTEEKSVVTGETSSPTNIIHNVSINPDAADDGQLQNINGSRKNKSIRIGKATDDRFVMITNNDLASSGRKTTNKKKKS